MPTTFWDVSPDILLQLCDYFSINELCFVFYPDVLPHMFELLNGSYKQLHFNMTHDHRLNTKLLSLVDTNKIISLRLPSCDVLPNVFHAVKTLILYDLGIANSVISVPFVLPSLQHLVLIYTHRYNYLIESTLKLVFTHSTLKCLTLQSNDVALFMPNNPVGESLSIQQLVIHASCSYTMLMFYLNSLPNLRTLRIRVLIDTQSAAVNNQNNVAIDYPSLETLDLVWYCPTMAYIKSFLIRFSNLKHCRISGMIRVKELDSNAWNYIITQRCSKLLRVNINMLVWIANDENEIKETFDQDTLFKKINFELIPNEKETNLFVFLGNFQRFL